MKNDKSPRLNAETKRSSVRFNCARLGRKANLTIDRTYCVHQNSADTHLEETRMVRCENWFDCGLYMKGLEPRQYQATSDFPFSCDAYQKIKEKGML